MKEVVEMSNTTMGLIWKNFMEGWLPVKLHLGDPFSSIPEGSLFKHIYSSLNYSGFCRAFSLAE